MRNVDELMINEGGEPVARRPATDEDFDRFERRCRVSIPADLRRLLRHVNGGHPRLDSFATAGARFSISRFFYLSEDDQPGGLSYAVTYWQRLIGTSAFPFAGDGCGNVFFVDSRDAQVKICLHDDNMRVVSLGESFEGMINKLEIDPDET